jgi:hypothetical protein
MQLGAVSGFLSFDTLVFVILVGALQTLSLPIAGFLVVASLKYSLVSFGVPALSLLVLDSPVAGFATVNIAIKGARMQIASHWVVAVLVPSTGFRFTAPIPLPEL